MHPSVTRAAFSDTGNRLKFDLDDGYTLILVLYQRRNEDAPRIYHCSLYGREAASVNLPLTPPLMSLAWEGDRPVMRVHDSSRFQPRLLRPQFEAVRAHAQSARGGDLAQLTMALFDHDWPRLDKTLSVLAAQSDTQEASCPRK